MSEVHLHVTTVGKRDGEGPLARAELDTCCIKFVRDSAGEGEYVHPTPYTPHPTPCTLHPTPYTLHPLLCILHPTPFTLHPAPCTLHPAPYILTLLLLLLLLLLHFARYRSEEAVQPRVA